MKAMGISDPTRVYDTNELAPGKKIIFAATGVTDGTIIKRKSKENVTKYV